jgi:hypothetical protein
VAVIQINWIFFFEKFKSSLVLGDGKMIGAFDPCQRKRVTFSIENDYFLSYYSVFPISGFNGSDLEKLSSKKWERLKCAKLSNSELDIVFRFWHDALLSHRIAQAMNLISNGKCPYCSVNFPNNKHLVYCESTDSFWVAFWTLVRKVGFNPTEKSKIFGYDNKPKVNTMIFLAIVVLYRRFLYNVNSGKTSYDLIKVYKQALYEKIYMDFLVMKSEGSISMFDKFWGSGEGLFVIEEGLIDIRL